MIRVYHFMSIDLGNFKTGYLLVYNGIQWSCFILVVVSLLKLLRGGLGKQCSGPTPKQSGNKTTKLQRLYVGRNNFDVSFGERERKIHTEILEPEAGAVDSGSIRSGKVPVQAPQARTPSARDLHLKTRQCAQQ